MHAEPEGEVLVRRAADVEAERVGEHLLVPVGRRVREQDGVARLERWPAQRRSGVVQLRMKCLTGVTQRMISSTAVGSSDGSACRRASWSGCSMSAWRPPAIADDVVSWPAVATIT